MRHDSDTSSAPPRPCVRFFVLALAASLFAGCLTPAPPAPVNWTIEWRPHEDAVTTWETLPLTLRVADVVVRAPYSGTRLPVLRADGSLAFDAYNIFAAPPGKLMKGAAVDAIVRSKRFRHVIGHESQAKADLEMEVTVTRLALDCRTEGRRDALVELTVAFIDEKGGVLAVGPGRASVPVSEGNFSTGFSRAFSGALYASADVIAALPQEAR